MGLKHKKKRLLDIYDIGKGSGNADFANMTKEEKMQVRKDLGLYYSDGELRDKKTNLIHQDPNNGGIVLPDVLEGNHSSFRFSKAYGTFFPTLDEDQDFIDNYDFDYLDYDGEGGHIWSCYYSGDHQYFKYKIIEDTDYYYYKMTGSDQPIYYFPEGINDNNLNIHIEKGLYMAQDIWAIRCVSDEPVFKLQTFVFPITEPIEVIDEYDDFIGTYYKLSNIVPENLDFRDDPNFDEDFASRVIATNFSKDDCNYITYYNGSGFHESYFDYERQEETKYYYLDDLLIIPKDTTWTEIYDSLETFTLKAGIYFKSNIDSYDNFSEYFINKSFFLLHTTTVMQDLNEKEFIETTVHPIEQKYIPGSGDDIESYVCIFNEDTGSGQWFFEKKEDYINSTSNYLSPEEVTALLNSIALGTQINMYFAGKIPNICYNILNFTNYRDYTIPNGRFVKLRLIEDSLVISYEGCFPIGNIQTSDSGMIKFTITFNNEGYLGLTINTIAVFLPYTGNTVE